MDPNISVLFDGRPGLRFVQGEDRLFSLTFGDKNTGAPLDLTGGTVDVTLPGVGTYPVKRSSGALALSASMIATPATGIVYPVHGLVTGDPVTFAGSALPAPLVAGTPYLVKVVDDNIFKVTDALGVDVPLTSSGTGAFTMSNAADVTIPNPSAGLVALSLRSAVTASVAAGTAQSLVVGVRLSGKLRLVVIKNGLDVTSPA